MRNPEERAHVRRLETMPNLQYKIIRSKRKSLSLTVDRNGEVLVRAPLRVPNSAIDRFVEEKKAWIARTRRRIAEFDASHPPMSISEGGNLMFMGRYYGVVRTDSVDIAISGNTIRIPRHYDGSKVVAWMKAEASHVIGERVSHYAAVTKLTPLSIRLTNARTRWGSCGGAGGVNFTWRLILCPLPVIDYVVVHELCHLVHRNHGRHFWESVENILPQYKEAENWLKDNGKLIRMI